MKIARGLVMCSFCGASQHEAAGIVGGDGAYICASCLVAALHTLNLDQTRARDDEVVEVLAKPAESV